MNEAICVENLVKTYDDGAGIRTPVLKGVSFSVATGDMVAVIGASGSGIIRLENGRIVPVTD